MFYKDMFHQPQTNEPSSTTNQCGTPRSSQEFDGSDSGARPDEAVSWGKIRVDAQPVKARRRDFVASMRWDGLQTLLGEAETG